MNKTLRIFVKDCRHLWPEILVSLALAVGFVATDHFSWPQFRNGAFRESGTLRTWMQILMPISWALLVARAVHDESLVGDHQFWVTRPYGWPRILAAKLLFIAAFILAPYFIAQCVLLHQAGLHPLAVLPGLAFTLLAVFGLFLLPLMALSAVTSTVTRIFIIIFVLALYIALVFYIASISGTPAAWIPGSNPPYLAATLVIALLITLVVVLLQYGRRCTAVSVALLVALVAIVTACSLMAYYLPNRIGDYHALAGNEPAPMTVTLDPEVRHQLFDDPKVQAWFDAREDVQVQVPLIFSGIAPGHAINFDGETATISSPGAQSRTIPWSGPRRQMLFPGYFRPYVSDSHSSLMIPSWMVREFAGKQASIHLTYAVTELEAESPIGVPFNGAVMDVPQNGHCIKVPDMGIVCQYALADPGLTHVTWKLQTYCDGRGTELPQAEWFGDPEHSIRGLDISPFGSLFTSFHTKNADPDNPHVYGLCPGAPFTFTRYHVSRRRLIEVTLPPLDPQTYVAVPLKLRQHLAAGRGSE